MHLLLSNDDGYLSPGLTVLSDCLADLGRVSVVAPDRDRSGASNSLTLNAPLRVQHGANGFLGVDGTPTDCVHLALTGLLEQEPDVVVSGINHGANMGDDVIYSGTVAAAMEGRFLGLPALAVSIASYQPQYLESAGKVARLLVSALFQDDAGGGVSSLLGGADFGPNTILNVNVPDRPFEQLRGFKATRLGARHKAESVVPARDPRGHTVYWVGAAGPEQDAGEGTDFCALREGFVSVTPLQVDLTRHRARPAVADWLARLDGGVGDA